MNAREIRDFNAYLANCTDSQVRGVFEKERAAGREAEAELARAAAAARGVYLPGDDA